MTRKLIISLFFIGIFLLPQSIRAQDSLRLLATMMGEEEGDFFIYCASAGDLNADGFMDIIIGGSSGEGGKGYVKIYFGSSDFDTIPEFRIVDDGNFGKSVACAGDVNKDGYADIVVGAPTAYNYNTQASLAGKAHVYFGGSPMDTVVDVILQDSYYHYTFGLCVTSAGDVNGDGYDDVVIAAPDDIAAAGRVFIYFGAENMDSIYDVRIEGPSDSAEHFGWSVAGIGDINSDEYDDILIGRPYAGVPWGSGKASVYFGGSPMDTIPDIIFQGDIAMFYGLGRRVSSAGDVNSDGVNDILVANAGGYSKLYYTLSTEPDLSLDTLNLFGEDIIPTSFGRSVSTAGDINKDGFDDFVVTDTDCGLDLKGKAYVFYGGEDVDSLWDLTLSGRGNRKEHFGLRVALAGDINGDGWDEMLVSSHFDSTLIGEVFIFTSNPTSVDEPDKGKQVHNFHLSQNYPNPLNSTTTIPFTIPSPPVNSSQSIVHSPIHTTLSVYNILGQKVKILVDENKLEGYYQATWDGKNQAGKEVSSGVYFYRLKAGEFTQIRKMLFIK